MRLNKFKRGIFIVIAYSLLLTLPIFEEVQYAVIYYIGVILSIPFAIFRIVAEEKFEERFYRRWHKARKLGFWKNVMREGFKSFALMIVMVSFSQFIGNGLTPLEIVKELPGNVLIFTLLFLLVFSLIVGIIAWYENNKRYNRIHYIYKNNN